MWLPDWRLSPRDSSLFGFWSWEVTACFVLDFYS